MRPVPALLLLSVFSLGLVGCTGEEGLPDEEDTDTGDECCTAEDSATPGDPDEAHAQEAVDALFNGLDPVTLDQAEAVEAWSVMSGAWLMTVGLSPILLWEASKIEWSLSGEPGEPDCPVVVDNGDAGMSITGGCTDFQGLDWTGSYVLTSTTEVVLRAVFTGFGVDITDSACPDVAGRLLMDGLYTSEDGLAFALLLASDNLAIEPDDCTLVDDSFAVDATIEQAETVASDGSTTTVFSSVAQAAMTLPTSAGTATVTTVEERINGGLCGTEALSGTTTFDAANGLAVITYDGETDCDPESTATWTLDGVDMGTLRGVSCSTGPATGLVLWLPAMLFAGFRRRLTPGQPGSQP